MTNIPEFFKGLRITSYYKYILYIAGIIFLLSLFLDFKELNMSYVRKLSFWAIIVSLADWFLEDGIIVKINNYMYEDQLRRIDKDPREYNKNAFVLSIVNVMIQGLGWLIFIYVFILK